MDMQEDVLILCGGFGKRLRSKIGESQKVMAAIDDQPFLNIILYHLRQQGFQKVALGTGYKAENVEEFYRENNFGLDISFSNETEPLGTGGAVKNAKEYLKSNPFFVLNGDSFCAVDYKAFLEFHMSHHSSVSVAVSKSEERQDYGSITVDDVGHITSFKEKESSSAGFVNAGVYCFSQEAFSLMPEQNVFSLETDFFPGLEGKGLYGFKTNKEFYDIGTPERLQKAKQELPRAS